MKFLLVDDDGAVGTSIGEHISGLPGFSSWQLCHSSGAIDQAMSNRPDVVLFILPTKEAFGAAISIIDDLKELLSVRILIAGPGNDAKLILQSQSAGVFQYLDIDLVNSELVGVLRRLQVEPATVTRHGRVITLISAGGGAGTSTMAVNLAAAYARKVRECGLMDLHAGDLATLLDLTPRHNLASFCEKMRRMDADMFRSCFVRHKSGIHLLAGSGNFDRFEGVHAAGVRKAIAMARNAFPYVVIDVGTHSPRQPADEAVRLADVVLLVMRHDMNSLGQAQHVLRYLLQLPVEKRRLHIVVNRFRRSRGLQTRDIEDALGIPLLKIIEDDPRHLLSANSRGIPIILEKPRNRVSKALSYIADQVNGVVTE